MAAPDQDDRFWTDFDKLVADCRTEHDRLGRELSELQMLQRQTSAEIDRLTERDLSIANRMRDMEVNLESYSRSDIKNIFQAAHETQMRLFMMRTQIEQLQGKQDGILAWRQRFEQIVALGELSPKLGEAEEGSAFEGIAGASTEDESADETVARVIEAQEAERLLISRQMHDGPAQSMTNLILRAEICERLLDVDQAKAKEELRILKSMINTTLQDTRRFIFSIRPMILDDLGLVPTLRRYLQDVIEKGGLQVDLSVSGAEDRLPRHIEVAIFRIVQEALDNIIEHARATKAYVTLEVGGGSVRATVEDDGSGFDLLGSGGSGEGEKTSGLAGMRHRVEMLRGQVEISSNFGQGTRIAAAIPIQPRKPGVISG